ncbi:MAG: helix-turn-helix transcriptional regulator [Oscillospiraceae bacterium]|nr:helix-turn-helix transcriptional regulator [Oscillospiraceae bacterium]
MRSEEFNTPVNPYHYVLHCIGGKWKMTILHEIHARGSIRFNQTLKILPISEKVFSQQLRELVSAGLIERIAYDTVPPKVEYVLTTHGETLIPALDILYIWSIRRMDELDIPIDENAFSVHKSGKYLDALGDIMHEQHCVSDEETAKFSQTDEA